MSKPLNWMICPRPQGAPGKSFRQRTVVGGHMIWKNKTQIGRWMDNGQTWMSLRPKKGMTMDEAARLVARRESVIYVQRQLQRPKALKLTRDRRVINRTTGAELGRLEGPTEDDPRPGWIIVGEHAVHYPSAGSCLREIAFRHGLS